MFFAISFTNHRIPIVAHCQWKQAGQVSSDCVLSLYPSQDAIKKSLSEEKDIEGRPELSALVEKLPRTTAQETVRLYGDVASTLAHIVCNLEYGTAYMSNAQVSDLSGFWGPPENKPSGNGILVWIDPEARCHVAIVHSKHQARSVARSLCDWMRGAKMRRWLAKIDLWNMPETTPQELEYLEGDVAELMHWGSLVANARGANTSKINGA